MGANVNLKVKNGIVRGSRRELIKFCNSKNLPGKHIQKDDKGYFFKCQTRYGRR